jgi:ABC-type phosphate transport system ATPase subunit
MDSVKIIEIKKSVFEDNDRAADALRGELKRKGVYLLNLMSAPGSGKTTTLIQTINRLKDQIRIAISTDMTIIYCQNEHGDLKMVYSYEPKKRENIYHEGEWEKIIAARYQALKNTAR